MIALGRTMMKLMTKERVRRRETKKKLGPRMIIIFTRIICP